MNIDNETTIKPSFLTMEYRLNNNYNIVCYIVRYNARTRKYEVENMKQEKENYENEVTKQTEQSVKKMLDEKQMKVILPVAAVLFIAVILGIFLLSGAKNVELKNYLNASPEITGLSGRASMDMDELFDESEFSAVLLDGVADASQDELENMTMDELNALFEKKSEIYEEYDKARKSIQLKVWKNGETVSELTNLANGDVIKIEAGSNSPDNKFFDKKFKTGSIQFKINGLTEGKSVDVFDKADFEISFAGVNGSGKVVVNWNASGMDDLTVRFAVKENTNAYSNGDKVEIVVEYDVEEWTSKGYYPREEYRIVTVEGLTTYLTSMEDITDEQLDQMKISVENEIKRDAKEKWYKEISIENISYVGSCLLNKREGIFFYGPENLLYMVFKVDVYENYGPNGGEDTHFSYYTYGLYEGLLIDEKNNIELENIPISLCWEEFDRVIKMNASSVFGYSTVYYNGYETLEELFRDNVIAYEDKYSYESTIKVVE